MEVVDDEPRLKYESSVNRRGVVGKQRSEHLLTIDRSTGMITTVLNKFHEQITSSFNCPPINMLTAVSSMAGATMDCTHDV